MRPLSVEHACSERREVWATNNYECAYMHANSSRRVPLASLMVRGHAFAWVFELEMGDAFCKAAAIN